MADTETQIVKQWANGRVVVQYRADKFELVIDGKAELRSTDWPWLRTQAEERAAALK